MIVGLNRYATEGAPEPAPFVLDPETERAPSSACGGPAPHATSARRRAALATLHAASGTTENLVPRVLACVEAKATLGEVMADARVALRRLPTVGAARPRVQRGASTSLRVR